MIIKQLTVFAENRRGCVAEITELLAQNGINLRAVSIADTKDFGIIRMITETPEKALELLKSHDITGSITEVIGVNMPHRPGSLSEVLSVLSAAGLDIEYLYAFLSGCESSATLALRVNDNEKAVSVLEKAGFNGVEPF